MDVVLCTIYALTHKHGSGWHRPREGHAALRKEEVLLHAHVKEEMYVQYLLKPAHPLGH